MIEIRKTDDGSHTLFVPELNEHYHSSYGAVQESLHVFIEAGLEFISTQSDTITILEVGFGTGLNTLLSVLHSNNYKSIHYTGVEAFPVEMSILRELNFSACCKIENAKVAWDKIHVANWSEDSALTDSFTLRKIHAKIQNISLESEQYDLIYFDAFAPEVQPELWTVEIFRKLFKAMKPGGVLVTYSSKGLVKQNLRASGFEVKRLAGPPGKRHMVRARKI